MFKQKKKKKSILDPVSKRHQETRLQGLTGLDKIIRSMCTLWMVQQRNGWNKPARANESKRSLGEAKYPRN